MLLSLFARITGSAKVMDKTGPDVTKPSRTLAPTTEDDETHDDVSMRLPEFDKTKTILDKQRAASADETEDESDDEDEEDDVEDGLTHDDLAEAQWLLDTLLELVEAAATFGLEGDEMFDMLLALDTWQRALYDAPDSVRTRLPTLSALLSSLKAYARPFKQADLWYQLVECETALEQLAAPRS
ncbi:hypothetical protein SPRG_00189 [Saprolegnia parasitica CBS 223.65]|uniref:Uncharacterized protein n=1 Tax=Saprolegnia parasitica (strain CBS 223.65) TaxID=695850 RepID=A0A067D1G9_SAPPC|nr:hypothetical protein SPRG_00189 [Saprolegnia parasitica CBS 223.65]KDO35340.1 hypothetical protein SPRG_00189 [Saprolegnia parasitica CBS 223.65]|eukprot:XP_012193686.1 hypothetical protein SPRG_00189 [Saprolegnia parasitica CBS 223.65]